MKKFLIVIGSIVFLISGGIYVNRHLPEWMIQVGLLYLEKTDYALVLDNNRITLDEDQTVIAKEVIETMNCEVEGSEIVGDEAFVRISMTLVDLMQLSLNEKERVFQNTLADWQQTLDDLMNDRLEGIVLRQLALIIDQVQEKPMKTMVIEIPFEREYLWWCPVVTNEWVESVVMEYLK
ncbi:MAG: hypothetical protein K2G70_02305 [Turicibacter sp.]|nr:hypothetical protein [Turicibacter sp.]